MTAYIPPPELPQSPQPVPTPHYDSVAHNYQQAYGWSGGAPPPPGYGRGGRGGGMPSWAKVLIISCVVMLGGCGALLGIGFHQLRKIGALPNIPTASVSTGTPIAWIELDKWKNPGGFMGVTPGLGGSLGCGNFDSDPKPEIMVQRQDFASNPRRPGNPNPGSIGNAKLYELSGGSSTIPLGQNSFMSEGIAWDYDGDGVLEIVLGFSPLEVYSASGKLLHTINGSMSIGNQPAPADVDGDGRLDLLLGDNMSGGQMALGLNGQRIWGSPSATYGTAWGNVDSDKFAEMIEDTGNGLSATDMNGQQTTLAGYWNSTSSLNTGAYSVTSLICADINGDGLDEVIDPVRGFLDPKAGKFTTLARPTSQNINTYSAGYSQHAGVAGDFDGNGSRELAVSDSSGSTSYSMALGTALLIYRADGTLQYNEEFGSEVHGLASVRDGQRNRLVVLLSDRLLLAP